MSLYAAVVAAERPAKMARDTADPEAGVEAMRKRIAELEAQRDTITASGHRLALELECLLLDCKDNVVVSRWMDTACEAIDAWHSLFPYDGPRLGD